MQKKPYLAGYQNSKLSKPKKFANPLLNKMPNAHLHCIQNDKDMHIESTSEMTISICIYTDAIN